ncbi:hypothetical protein HY249_01230, partial [Candidatus Azambacteria bacterium]|nr:hypothetical protein [Candidatus Azambacteria bacterium]
MSNVMYPWNFGKILFFQVFVDILALLAGVYFLVSKKTFKRFTFLDYAVLAFFSSQLLSAFFGFDFSQSFFGDQGRASGVFTWLHFGVFYFLLRQFFDAKKDWFLTGSFAVFIGVASSVLAWLGKYFPDYLSVATFGDRLSGLIGNPIFFASYIIFPLFLAFYFFINTPNEAKIKKWLYFSAGVFLLISLVASEVRGAFVGLLASIFIIWIFLGFSDLFSKKIRTYIL